MQSKLIGFTVLVFGVYMAFADHGAPHHAAPTYHEEPHYAPPVHHEPAYAYGYHEPVDPVVPNLYPSAVIGGLGSLGMAYFLNRIDDSYNRSLHAFEALHHNVDHRLEHLEEMMAQDGKDNKKLDFKTKVLCKFANLFNNPTYEICNQGFDAGQVIGPTGGAGSGPSGSVVG